MLCGAGSSEDTMMRVETMVDGDLSAEMLDVFSSPIACVSTTTTVVG